MPPNEMKRERTVQFAPHLAADVDLIKREQDRRIQRRIGFFNNILPESREEGFKERASRLIEIYEKHLKQGTGISELGDATFIQGLIRNMDHEMGNHWDFMLKKIRDGLEPDDPARGGLDRLIELLPKTYSHLTVEKELAEKVDKLIRECKDPSALYEDIKQILPDKEGYKSIENLDKGYGKRREKQLGEAPREFYPKWMRGLDDIFEGQVVTPTAEGKGRSPEHHLKRLKRRTLEFGKTDFMTYRPRNEFMENFGPIVKELKAGAFRSRYGSSFMAQAVNIYISKLAENWMKDKLKGLDSCLFKFTEKQINGLGIPGSEEVLSDLKKLHESDEKEITLSDVRAGARRLITLADAQMNQIKGGAKKVNAIEPAMKKVEKVTGALIDLKNIPFVLSHLARTRDLVSKTANEITAGIAEIRDSPEDEKKAEKILRMRDRANKVLVGKTYVSYSGKRKARGALSTQHAAYEGELLLRDNDMDEEYVKNQVAKTRKTAKNLETLKSALTKIVNSDNHGLAESEAITRELMNTGWVTKLGAKEKMGLEGYIGSLFRERDLHMRNLNVLFRQFVEASLGKLPPREIKSMNKKIIRFNLAARDKELKKIIRDILQLPTGSLEDEHIKAFHEAAESGKLERLLTLFTERRKRIPSHELASDERILNLIARVNRSYQKEYVKPHMVEKWYHSAEHALQALQQLDSAYTTNEGEIRELSSLTDTLKESPEGEQMETLDKLPEMLEQASISAYSSRLNGAGERIKELAEEVRGWQKASNQEKLKQLAPLIGKLEHIKEKARVERIPQTTNWRFANDYNKTAGPFKVIVSQVIRRGGRNLPPRK